MHDDASQPAAPVQQRAIERRSEARQNEAHALVVLRNQPYADTKGQMQHVSKGSKLATSDTLRRSHHDSFAGLPPRDRHCRFWRGANTRVTSIVATSLSQSSTGIGPDMNAIRTVSVCGLGRLGACIAATVAARGFDVVGIDVDPDKVSKINDGMAPVEEPYLAETIRAGHSRLHATLDARKAASTDVTFFIPPTPSLPDGSFSNEFLLNAMQPVARAVKEARKKKHLFVCSSTTTPGAVDTVLIPMLEREIGGRCGVEFGVCYNPEFIALGNVINGLLEPDLVLIGQSDQESGALLERFYKAYNRNSPPIARMSIVSAELMKISLNSYITMKVSFTNQVRLIAARHPQADIHAILDALGSDSRVGKKYLRAGLSYGGPCFPRDNRMLAWTARQVGVDAPLAEATDRINERTKQDLVDKVRELAAPSDTVAVLGVTYKPDTHITDEAAGLFLAQQLKRQGYRVLVHDFLANTANAPCLSEFELIGSWQEFKQNPGVNLAVICCPWPQYQRWVPPAAVKVFSVWKS
jgi:UDPglucose 6-dehydrogenase